MLSADTTTGAADAARTPKHCLAARPLRWLLLGVAGASTVWQQLPLLPGGLVGQGPGLTPVAVADLLLGASACAGVASWLWRRRGPPLASRGIFVAGLLVVGSAVLGAPLAVNVLLAWGTAVHLALLFVLYLLLAGGALPSRQVAAALLAGLAVQAPLVVEQVVRQTTAPVALLLAWPRDMTPETPGASVLLTAAGARWLRPYGPFFHPNILGGYLALELVLLAGFLVLGQAYRGGPAARWSLGGAAGVAAMCLVLSASRGAWLGALAGLVALGVGARRAAVAGTAASVPVRVAAGPWMLGVLIASLGVAVSRPPLLERFDPVSNRLEQQSVQERLFLDGLGVDLLLAHPVLGVGAGDVDDAVTQEFHGAYTPAPMHNVPLLMAVELGPAGALAWVIAAGTILWQTWRRPGAWTVVFAAALVVVGVAGLFDHYFWRFPAARITVVVLAGAWAAASRAEQPPL